MFSLYRCFYLESGTIQSPGIQNSMLSSTQGKATAFGGMIRGNALTLTDSKNDYVTSFKKNGNMETNGMPYYMNTSPTVMVISCFTYCFKLW